MKNRITGWTITEYTELGAMGIVKNTSSEFGNSPIRDRKSLKEEIIRLLEADIDFDLVAIQSGYKPERVKS